MRARISLEAGDCLPQTLDLAPGQPVTLGRSRDNTIVLRDELASRLHAKIYFEEGRWHIRDFGLNGTRVDGVRVNGAVELGDMPVPPRVGIMQKLRKYPELKFRSAAPAYS